MPKRVKYRCVHRGRMEGSASRGSTLTYGDYGIQALKSFWITSNQVEAARRAMTRCIHHGRNIWIKIFPDKPVTEKPAETRMGSGRGTPSYWVSTVKPGRVLFKTSGASEETTRGAMRLASNKPLIKTRFVARYEEKDGESSES